MRDEHPVLSPADAERVIRRYANRLAEHGLTTASLNSGSVEAQRLRHRIHAAALQGPRPSILDVGCGLGLFYEYLMGEGRSVDYTGYDLVPEYIEHCQTRFPGGRFARRNIFSDGIDATFDTVVMSQTLNNRYQDSDNVEVMETAVRLAFAAARVSVSIDMLSSYVEHRRDELFYYSPEAMFAFAKRLTPRVILRHDYRSGEFCLQLFHASAEGYLP